MSEQNIDPKPKSNDPLHGVTLESIVRYLVEFYGWDDLADAVPINCFRSNPTVNSSLKFLRKTPWARAKVESFYLYTLRRQARK